MVLLRALPLIAALAAAQDLRPGLSPVPTYDVHRASSRIVVDGDASEAAWKAAPSLALQFPWDQQTGAKQKTTVRMLWSSEFLYLFYDCEDTDVVAHYTDHDDPTYKDDAVELFINPDPKQEFYYGLEINARAAVYDYFYAFPRLILKRLDFQGLQLAVHVRGTANTRGDQDKGWTLELAIPWRNFTELRDRVPPAPGEIWAANLNRWDGVEPDRRLSIWSDSGLTTPHPHNPARFGKLVFVE